MVTKSIKELKIKKGEILFSISVSYAVIYDIDDIKTLDQKMLTVFGKDNAFYNVYPYIVYPSHEHPFEHTANHSSFIETRRRSVIMI